jgi:hypothetical protein
LRGTPTWRCDRITSAYHMCDGQGEYGPHGVLNVLANWVRPADDPKKPSGKIAPNKELVKAIVSILSQIDTQWLDRECLNSSGICKSLLEAVSLEKKESENFQNSKQCASLSAHTLASAHTSTHTPMCAPRCAAHRRPTVRLDAAVSSSPLRSRQCAP